jgi:hypothetical protein
MYLPIRSICIFAAKVSQHLVYRTLTDTVMPEKGKAQEGAEDPVPEYNHTQDEMGLEYDDGTPIPCPPHTTERKLVAKIDLHVIPFLCIMYLLAFLDR